MAAADYTARHLSVLEGLEAVRKRPGMYIGSTDSRGLMHCLWEIIDNSVDEALAGHGTEIEVVLHPDGSVEVRDKARGLPIDIEPRTGLTGVEVIFTKLHAGGKFGGGAYSSSGGLHGVGASVVNALSQRLDVEVDRDGATWSMSFERGKPVVFHDSGEPAPDSPSAPSPDGKELRKTGKVTKKTTGTRVRYWADPQIFTKGAEFQFDDLVRRARQTAFLVPGLAITLTDERGEEVQEQRFQYEGGISEFVEYLAPDEELTPAWRFQGVKSFSETVPVLDEKTGHMVSAEVERECTVDIALRWGTGYETTVHSFVNIIATPKGGTHLAGFEQSLTKTLRDRVAQNARKLKAGSDKLDKDDVLAGLTAVVTVSLPEPQFEGQTKEVLGTPPVRQIVSQVVSQSLAERFESSKREDKTATSTLLEKVVSEMKARISARAMKETARRKSALESSSLPAKLADCRSKSVENTELFIVEGDSALGTAKPARDSEYQAILPIRGKILNVQKASVADMLANAECAAIMQCIGAGSGRSFDISQIRYGKLIILSDADVDGAHIRTLILTLLHRYMRPLIEAGRVYAAVPPLHRVQVKHARKPDEIIYTHSDEELHQVLTRLRKSGKKWVEPPQRYKGLGEMDVDQLAETTMDRTKRTLRRVTIQDGEAAEQIFNLLMGNDVTPRRDLIMSSQIDRDRIDA
ncbi:MAG: DNA gyrase/topoisomerase IV subunit B [Agrococcus casei]|uniref:DNA gyrase/topoisomerase IV subunit B n=1 Tax=Agrococcus casei TaxID=343512 RepID=UPI003F8EC4D7